MTEVRVLLAGDSRSFPANLRAELMSVGLGITQCESAVDVIRQLREKGAHALVSAAQLKELSGYQLACLLKSDEITQGLPIVLVDDSDGQQQLLAGFHSMPDVLSKTEDAQVLAKVINKLILGANKKGWLGAPIASLLPDFESFQSGPFNNLQSFLLDCLLIEKLVTSRTQALLDKTSTHRSLVDAFFSSLSSFVHFDFAGIVVATLQNPWAAFSGEDGLSRSAFEKLLRDIKDKVSITEELALDTRLKISEKRGQDFGDLKIVTATTENAGTGLLVFGKYGHNKLSPNEHAVINSLRANAQSLMKLLIAKQEIDTLQTREAYAASIDPLTGLYNLEFFVGFLQQQLLFSYRQKLAVALILIDIDNFANLNNIYGPRMGDAVLQKMANRVLSTTRASDLLARYGGDEFGIVLPNTELSGAKVLADKLRLEIEHMNFVEGHSDRPPRVTVSVGCAQFDMNDLNPETILRDAKHALQQAKESGRNRVAP